MFGKDDVMPKRDDFFSKVSSESMKSSNFNEFEKYNIQIIIVGSIARPKYGFTIQLVCLIQMVSTILVGVLDTQSCYRYNIK